MLIVVMRLIREIVRTKLWYSLPIAFIVLSYFIISAPLSILHVAAVPIQAAKLLHYNRYRGFKKRKTKPLLLQEDSRPFYYLVRYVFYVQISLRSHRTAYRMLYKKPDLSKVEKSQLIKMAPLMTYKWLKARIWGISLFYIDEVYLWLLCLRDYQKGDIRNTGDAINAYIQVSAARLIKM